MTPKIPFADYSLSMLAAINIAKGEQRDPPSVDITAHIVGRLEILVLPVVNRDSIMDTIQKTRLQEPSHVIIHRLQVCLPYKEEIVCTDESSGNGFLD